MELICPTCQKKLQIADSYGGQVVKCPSCAATFQAPSLPSAGPLPTPEPIVPVPVESAAAPFSMLPDSAGPTPSSPPPLPPAPEVASPPQPKGEYTRSFTINLRQRVVRLIPPYGMAALFLLSFFPWLRWGLWTPLDPLTPLQVTSSLNLWELAFTAAGSTVFLFYVLLLIIAAPVVFMSPLLERKLVPTPPALRPYLPWGPTAIAILTLATWLLFLIPYFRYTFIDVIDPATLWMKLAFRLHALIVMAAVLDYWLDRRKVRGLPEPTMKIQW